MKCTVLKILLNKMKTCLLYLILIIEIFIICDGSICLKWRIQNKKLILNCKVHPLNLRVSFYNQDKEQAYCVLPYPEPLCLPYFANGSVSQNLQANETVFIVEREHSVTIHERWKCLHGHNNEEASVFVTDEKYTDYRIRISAHKYVKKHQPIALLCSAEKIPIGHSANIFENGQLFMTLKREARGCFANNSLNECSTEICHCSEDGRAFFVKHNGLNHSGVLSFTCTMNYPVIGQVSDCVFVRVLDIDGPYVALNTTVPISAGSYVEVRCILTTTGVLNRISLTCVDYKNTTMTNVKSATYVASIIVDTKTEHHDSSCTCTATVDNYTTSESIKLSIIPAPILEVQNETVCREFYSVSLVCTAKGDLQNQGFESWLHIFSGKLVRILDGLVADNQSTLYLKSCTFEDNGEYVCRAWHKVSGDRIWTNKSTQVIVAGSPKIISKETFVNQNHIVLSAKYVTTSRLMSNMWFLDAILLKNSTGYSQSHREELVLMRVHSKLIDVMGFTTQLVIYNMNNRKQAYTLVVVNFFGNSTATFNSENEYQVFSSKVVYVVLVAVIVFVLACVSAAVISNRQNMGLNITPATVSVYYAAPQIENQVNNIYNITNSHYDEINNYEDIDEVILEQTIVHSDNQVHGNIVEDATDENLREIVHEYLELE